MEEKIISKINEASQMLDNYECKLRKHKKENNLSWENVNRVEICSNCLLGKTNISTYDIEDKIVKVNLCTLLDVMDSIKGDK